MTRASHVKAQIRGRIMRGRTACTKRYAARLLFNDGRGDRASAAEGEDMTPEQRLAARKAGSERQRSKSQHGVGIELLTRSNLVLRFEKLCAGIMAAAGP